MNRSVRILVISSILIVLALSFLFYSFVHILPEDGIVWWRAFRISMSVTFENRNSGAEVWNFTVDDRTIGLFMNNSWQMVYLMDSSLLVENDTEIDEDGNPIAILSFPKSGINSGETLSYTVTYGVVLEPRSAPNISEDESKNLNDIPEDLRGSYCGAEGLWLKGDPDIVNLAYEIAGNETRVLTIVKKFVDWIHSHIRYGTIDVPRYPNETLEGGFGDCDDQANLLITFCRIIGIPAFLQIGCIYIPQMLSEDHYYEDHFTSRLTRIGWHGWAVVYVPPWGWLPVDLTYVADLGEDPLNAIKTSAVIEHPTVQYVNITKTDYALDSRNLRDFLVAHGFYIYQEDVMVEEVIEGRVERSIPILRLQIVPVFRLLPTAMPKYLSVG